MHASDVLPMEFLNLPVIHEPTLDATQPRCEAVFMTQHEISQSRPRPSNETRDKLQESLKKWKSHQSASFVCARSEDDDASVARQRLRPVVENSRALYASARNDCSEFEPACFASHGSLGIVDLGATKTVIGSKLVPELLNGLDQNIRSQIKRCPCVVTFRFGNHGVLQSQQAIVVPLPGLLLKIAVVPARINSVFAVKHLAESPWGHHRYLTTHVACHQTRQEFSVESDQQGFVFA